MASTCCLSKLDDSEQTFFDEDPLVYEDRPPARRSSSHATMDGSRVHQDFGAEDADRLLHLRTDWMTQSTLDALEAKFATTGQVWKWVDHNANAFQVFFRELRPERIQGQAAYRVEIAFDIIAEIE